MKRSLTRFVIASFCVLFFLSISLTEIKAQKKAPAANNWPEWRGQYNSGTVMGGNTPSEFSETKNLNWKIEIPGKVRPHRLSGEPDNCHDSCCNRQKTGEGG